MFSLPYPSRATLSRLYLYGNGSAGSLVGVTGVGTSSARVYLRDVNMVRGLNANVRLGDCPNTVIDYYGMGARYNNVSPANGANLLLEGRGEVRCISVDGGAALTGTGRTAPVVDIVCTNGGSLYVETYYHECADSLNEKIFRVSGPSRVTFLSATLRSNLDPTTWVQSFARATTNGFSVADFSGQLLMGLAGYGCMDYYNISGATTGSIWICGDTSSQFSGSAWPVINSTADVPVQTMNWNWFPTGSVRYTNDVGNASAGFVRQMLSQARSEYADRTPMARRPGQTDVLMEHAFLELGQQNLWVSP